MSLNVAVANLAFPMTSDEAIYKAVASIIDSPMENDALTFAWRLIQARSHKTAVDRGWYKNPHTGESIERNVGELLMLVVSEIAEAMEGHRKGLMDDKLPHRASFDTELADAIIRIGDLAGALKLDLAGAIVEKNAYNLKREDHSLAARIAAGGKAY